MSRFLLIIIIVIIRISKEIIIRDQELQNGQIFQYVTEDEWDWELLTGQTPPIYTGIIGEGCLKQFHQNNLPGYHSSSITFVDKEKNELNMFGGGGKSCGSSSTMLLNDLWVFRVDDLLWKFVKGCDFCSSEPGEVLVNGELNNFYDDNIPRGMKRAVWFQSKDYEKGFIFGNNNNGNVPCDEYSNEMWEMDIKNNYMFRKLSHSKAGNPGVYKQWNGNNNYPNSMSRVVGIRPERGIYQDYAFMFGGICSNNAYNTMYQYDIVGNRFRWLSGSLNANDNGDYGEKNIYSPSSIPPGRYGGVIYDIKNVLYIGSGTEQTYYGLEDFFAYNITSGLWKWIFGDKMDEQKWCCDECIVDFYDFNENNTLDSSYKYTSYWNGVHDYLFFASGFSNCMDDCYGQILIFSISRNEIKFVNGTFDLDTKTMYGSLGSTDGEGGKVIQPPGKRNPNVWKMNENEIYFGFGYCYDLWQGSYYYHNDLWIYRYSNSECNGNGEYAKSGCICWDNYSGTQCEEWVCHNIDRKDEIACSGNGKCKKFNQCECSAGYYGLECKEWMCSGIFPNSTSVCNKKGECIGGNDCVCLEFYHGIECQEYIKKAQSDRKTINIEYVVDVPVLFKNGMQQIDDCSQIIENYNDLGVNSTCFWAIDSINNRTNALHIDLGYNSVIKRKIVVIPISKNEERVHLTISYIKNEVWIVIAGISSIVILVLFVGIVFLVCCYGRVISQKRKINKFHELKNIDMLISEQESIKEENFAVNFKVNKILFNVEWSDIKVLKRIGGHNTDIYICGWRGSTVCLKLWRVLLFESSKQIHKGFEKEISLHSSLKFPFLLEFFGACIKIPRIGILVEYAELGSYINYVLEKVQVAKLTMPYSLKLQILSQISSVIVFLHSKNIIHRNLITKRILLKKDLTAKLIGLNFSKVLKKDLTKMTSNVAISYFCAPEIIKGKQVNRGCDCYSFGIIMYQVLTHNFNSPFGDDVHEMEIANNPNLKPQFNLKSNYPKDYISLVNKTLDHSISNRPTFSVINKTLQGMLKKRSMNLEKDKKKLSSIKLVSKNDEITRRVSFESRHLSSESLVVNDTENYNNLNKKLHDLRKKNEKLKNEKIRLNKILKK